MSDSELLQLSATELARRIRAGELSSTDAVRTHIQRIETVNPLINAMVEQRFEQALTEARSADERLAGTKPDELPPYHGVPCSIKDCYALQGLPWSSGSLLRKDLIADRDATTVARYRKAGLIPLGKTNVPECAVWFDSYNKVYGTTRNPHDLTRTVGGSSGGEGAIIAAGGAPVGLGSDAAGSIRYPCFFNGIPGHKPTGGLVPGTGHFPFGSGEAARYFCHGPMSRKVEDLYPMLKILSGPDGQDAGAIEPRFGDPADIDLKKVTVYYYEDNLIWPLHPDVRFGMQRARQALEEAGIAVIPWWPKGMKRALDFTSSLMSTSEGHDLVAQVTAPDAPGLAGQILRYITGRSPHTLPLILILLEDWINRLLRRRNLALRNRAFAFRKQLEEHLGEHGVLMIPPFHRPAFKLKTGVLHVLGISYSAVYNVLETPATMVPTAMSADGLPVGVQLLGRRQNDHLTIRMAGLLEQALGGWSPVEPQPLSGMPLLGQ